MALIDVVLYAEECAGECEPGARHAPVVEWLDGVPRMARLRLISRLELLERHGAGFDGPHVIQLGARIRALWCRCEGAKHLILYAVSSSTGDDKAATAVLLHGCSARDQLSIVRDSTARNASIGGRSRLPRRGGRATALAAPERQQESAYAPMPQEWAGNIPEAEIVLAQRRLELYESNPAGYVLEL